MEEFPVVFNNNAKNNWVIILIMMSTIHLVCTKSWQYVAYIQDSFIMNLPILDILI